MTDVIFPSPTGSSGPGRKINLCLLSRKGHPLIYAPSGLLIGGRAGDRSCNYAPPKNDFLRISFDGRVAAHRIGIIHQNELSHTHRR